MLLRKRESSIKPLAPAVVALSACLMLISSGALAQPTREAKAPTTSVSPASQGKMYKGLLIRQSSDTQGNTSIYLCEKRWALKTGLISIIVDEEHDKVIAYTRQTNKYLLDTINIGMKRFKSFRRGGDFEWGAFSTVGHEKYHDESVIVLERKGRRTDLKSKNDVVITERQLSCPRIKLSKVFQEIAYALLDVEYTYGLPLKLSRMAHSANPRYCTTRPVVVQDTSIIKESTFPASEFEIPKGLTRVKTEVDLFTSDMDAPPGSATDEIIRRREKQLHVEPAKN
jgi:hypothetical protein